ncbi:MAG: hypothetical protein DLM59_12945 [Pseudonocardiales bacterium]|nr:MAG: hypothetical protein DLM59_12945 [Pseudonocardiales bacterium]
MVAYVRTVKTSSGATAVQIVHSTRRGSRKIEHLGSAHTLEAAEADLADHSGAPRGLLRIGSVPTLGRALLPGVLA